MSITYSFADNAVYGTEDINDITKSLVGAGVAPFVSKSSYSLSDLNVVTSALVGSGVQLEGCACTVNDAGKQNMSVNVAQGIVFFESGVRLSVDETGYSVAVSPNTSGFVYAYYNRALQTADILFDTTLPDGGEYVPLAEISVQGNLTDRRVFAQSKIATLGKNATYTTELTDMEQNLYEETSVGKGRYAIKEAVVDLSKFSHILILNKVSYDGTPECGGIFDIAANQFVFSYEKITHYHSVYAGTKKLITGANAIEYGFDILGGRLVFYAYCSPEKAVYIKKDVEDFSITFI